MQSPIVLLGALFLLISFCLLHVHCHPLDQVPLDDQELSFVEDFDQGLQAFDSEFEQSDHARRRVRRQSESGFGSMLSGIPGHLGTMRDNFRDTVRPVAQALNPRPHLETMGKFLQSASTNTMTRGREAVQGVRDFGSRSMTRFRDGVNDAWDNVRDGWEDLWDL